MAKPLLFQAPPRWQIWAFLGGALLLHGIAVVAAIKHEKPPADLTDIPTATVEASIEPPTDEPTPPPEDIPMPEPPPVPEVMPEFHEETTPPPKRPPNVKVAPVKAPQAAMAHPSGTMSITGAKAVAVFAPKPDYPYQARAGHITGSGVCVLSVDVSSGAVSDASMAQSTGNAILDSTTVSTFKRWRFRAGAVAPKVKVPITYTLSGASY
jgi:TonB family protein